MRNVRLFVRIEGEVDVELDDDDLERLKELDEEGRISVDDLPFEVDVMEVATHCADPEITDFMELEEE